MCRGGEFWGSIIIRRDGRTICGIVLLFGGFLFLVLIFFLPSNLAVVLFRAMLAGLKSSLSRTVTREHTRSMPMMVQRSVDDDATENDAEDVAA